MSQQADKARANHSCEEDLRSCSHRQRCIQTRWLIGATLFGALFPIVGWLVAGSGLGAEAITTAHTEQSVLYIVDLAPLVLGLAGLGIGAFHSRLIKIRHSIEMTVQDRTSELQQALHDLSATQSEKDRFVASVSHELRTPLTSVVGLAHALAESDQGLSVAEHDELLGLIVSESEEVASIVEDLLVAARVDSGQLTIVSEQLRLDEELCAIAAVCEVQVVPTRLEPVTVIGDRVRIHQILRNLITNAARYGGDTITVEVFRDRTAAVLAVKDDGEGVPEDELDLIFTAFGKAHHDPARTESVGLGLTVSRNLAQLMNGDVVYRRHEGWTSFELRLPRVPQSQIKPSDTHSSSSEEQTRSTKETIRYAGSH
jgi:signal transduction histidine kinase